MNFRYIPYTFALSVVLCSAAYAQETPETPKPTGTLTEEIVVERPYKPVLADAAKIRRSPDLSTTRIFKTKLNYSILDKKLDVNSDIRQLQAQTLSERAAAPLLNNYARAGIGNFSTGLAELYVNTGPDEALQAGAFIKHLNQEGSINRQEFSRQEIGLFGKSILDNISLHGELGFDRYSTFFYGSSLDTLSPFYADPQKQHYNALTLKGELLKNYQENEDSNYGAKADAYFLSDKFDAKENSIALSGMYNQKWNQFNIGINGSLDITSTKDSSFTLANHLFRANPYIKIQGDTYKLTLGVNLVQEFGDSTRFNFFPAVTAEMPIVPEFATIFAGFTGDVNKATLRNFSRENPYLNSNLSFLNEVEKTHFYGGIKGNAGAGFGYKATVFYKKLENMPMFVNNAASPERFDIIYDDAKVTGLEGEISVKVSDAFNWSGKVNINNYSMDTQEEAWFKPDFRLTSNARYSLNRKFSIDAELVLNDATSALTGTAGNRMITRVDSYVDFSAGAEYQYQEKFGIFMRVNNIFGKEYERFLYYPRTGLNIIGGLSYSF